MEKYKEGSNESKLVTTADGSEESKLAKTADGSNESKLVTTADGSEESKLVTTADGSEESKLAKTADGSEESKLAKTADGSEESKLAKTADGSNESNLVTTADGSEESKLAKTADGSEESKLVTTADGSNESKLVTTADGSEESKLAKTADGSEESKLAKTADGSNESKLVTTADGSNESKLAKTADGSEESKLVTTADGSEESKLVTTADGSNESKLAKTADGSEESKLAKTVDGSNESNLVTTADGSEESKLAKTADGSEESKLAKTADGSEESKLAKTADGSNESKLVTTADGSNESKLSKTADGSEESKLVTTADGSNEYKLAKTADGSNESKLVTTADGSEESKLAKTADGSEESKLAKTADGSEESKLVTTADGSNESKLVTTADGSNESKLAKTADGSNESKLVTTADGSNESKLAKTADGSNESKLAKTADGSNESKLVTTADGSNESKLAKTADGSEESKLVTTADGSEESKLVTAGYSSNEFKVAKTGKGNKVSVFREEPRQDGIRQDNISKVQRGQAAVASNVGGGTDDSTSSQVQLMEEETAVLVENLPRDLDKVLKGKIQKYFQSKRSGGAECQLISHRDSKRKAIVKFASKQVRNSVLAKGEHVIEVSSDEKVEMHVTAFTASPATPAEPGASIDLQTSTNDKSEESEKANETPLDKSTDTPEKPKPLKETLNSYLLNFITSNEEHMSELERALEKSRCKFKVLDVNTISLLPVNESITDHNEWQGSVTKMFTQFIEGYAHETIPCTEKEWQEVEINNEQKRDVDVLYKNGIQLTGKSDEVKTLKREIEDIMSKFNEGILVMNIDPLYFDLLQDMICMNFPAVQFEMDSKASRLYLKGNARKVEDAKKYIESIIENSDKRKCSFGSYLNDFIRKTDLNALVQMHFSDNNIKALCGFDENEIYIYSLEGYSEQAHDILNHILKDLLFLVTKKDVAVMKSEQWNVFFKKLEHRFSSGNINCILTPSKHNDGTCRAIYIAGIAEAVEKADKELTSYFKDNTAEEIIPLQNDTLCSCIIDYMKIIEHPALKSLSVERHDSLMDIIIMGHSEEVEKHKQSINNVVSKVNKELRKNERGVPDEKSISMFLEKYRGRNSRFSTQNQEEFAAVAGASERPVATQQRPPVRLPGNRFLFVHEDNILNSNVDVIVNAANEDLNHIGGLAKVLSDAGGTVIQQESDSYVRKHGRVPTGELAITGPGHLPCKKVFHAVGPAWGDYRHNTRQGIMLLRKVITNALKKADEEGFKSIAIPAISAGIFSFPLDICSKEICHAIFEYCKMTHDCPKTLTDIHIVDINHEFIYQLRKTIELKMNRKDQSEEQSSKSHKMPDEEEDEGPIKKIKFACYETEDRVTWEHLKKKQRLYAEMNVIQRNSFTTKEGRTIQVVFGNIEDQMTEVIVNSTFIGMKLDNGGAISAALLRKAGPALQDELDRKKTFRIGHGDIISTDTSKCRLSCKEVYHIVVQPVKSKGSVDKMTLDCLKKAHKAKVTSISFPALGTGILNFPPQQVARAMLSAAIQFSKEHKDDILQLIQIVILRSKPDIFKAFENEISSSISDSEARAPNLKQEERFQTGADHNKKLFKIQGITVELCSGDITQEKTDAIVNSTDTRMSVTTGICSAILKAAGHTIRDEFSKEHPKFGDIVVTTAGQLECKYILHIAGIKGNIEQTCSRILHECQKKNIKSVSFPAFGTGNEKLSPRNVASSMLNAIHAFAKENKHTIVTNIRIVFVENSLLNIFQDVFHGRIH